MPRFSIIIPAHNAEPTLLACLQSCAAQDAEIILIDDASTDATRVIAASIPSIRVASNQTNAGPGIARNRGLDLAIGDWIIFLDADDELAPGAIQKLAAAIDQPGNEDIEAIGFNWCDADGDPSIGLRRDHEFLALEKPALLRRYLSLHMDGAVTFTAVRADLLRAQKIRFSPGLHEDVDVLFFIYVHASRIAYIDDILYHKRRRPGSTMESMSIAHINGFVRAWREIGKYARDTNLDPDGNAYRTGTAGLIATRLRTILRHAPGESARPLMEALYAGWQTLAPLAGPLTLSPQPTQYAQIAACFLRRMAGPGIATAQNLADFTAEIETLLAANWSCTDLHHAIFLAPTEIRTCCKRFFVRGERRGDVVLMPVHSTSDATPPRIASAKKALHRAINRGDTTPCTFCPFLEFRPWGPITPLNIRTLSLEYHSVCNLKCTYCDETYYGGARPSHDPKQIIETLLADSSLAPSATIVWGGGEPVIDRDFAHIAERLAADLPNATQRVLTNAVRYTPTVARLLRAGRIAITTSLDAGTQATFTKIRGRDRLATVLANLRKYAAEKPAAVTLKYIFTAGNESLAEGEAFVAALREADLLACNIQISHDFKSDTIDDSTLVPIIALHASLVAAGAPVVFFDDLLRQRMTGLRPETIRALAANGLSNALLDADTTPDIVIWGAGWQAKFCLERAHFFRHRQPAFLVDSTPSKIGGEFLGFPIRDPACLKKCESKVLIAAAQGYPAIYRRFIELGLPASRLVTKVVI